MGSDEDVSERHNGGFFWWVFLDGSLMKVFW
jgi:hypothetical protein